MYNLNIYPINVNNGKPDKNLPGLISLLPPRKAARGRESDQLLLLVGLTGANVLTPEAFAEWLQKKGDVFYRTSGTVTSAMRALAESINTDLLDRNVKNSNASGQVNGSLCLAVLRKDIVYSLVIGQAKIFILGDGQPSEQTDVDNHPRGLGVNQALKFRFAQNPVKEKDQLLFATKPSPSWTVESLAGSTLLSVDAMGRRLFNQLPPTMSGALIRILVGKGASEFLTFPLQDRLFENDNVPAENPENPVSETLDQPEDLPESARVQSPLDISEPGPSQESHDRKSVTADAQPPSEAVPVAREVKIARPRVETNQEIKQKVGKAARGLSDLDMKSGKWFRSFLQKVLPAQKENGSEIPRSVLIIIALLVPLIVVVFASSVYLKKGKTQQFEVNFQQGITYAQKAEELRADPPARLANLQQSLFYLEKAALYGSTSDSVKLHEQVQKQLDDMQGIVRIKMVPIAENLDLGSINISQMAASNTDLYLLDSESGRVLRFTLTGKGYSQDQTFDCGPNAENPNNNIGKLVDLVAIPYTNKQDAAVLAIDARGKIEFCIPSKPGIVGRLPEPDAGWKDLRSISLDEGVLHVLDAGRNAVYRYQGDGLEFTESPRLYFDEDIPNLANAIDIEVNGYELYILRTSGEMVECTYSPMKDYKLTECLDPAPYADNRSSDMPQVMSFTGVQFIQMHMTDAPDSSLYLLDAAGRQLYHLSLKRNLQKVLTPGFDTPSVVNQHALTAEAISPGKVLFLAYVNQVYMGNLP